MQMLQAAYVTKNSFAISDSATIAGQVLPAREPSGFNRSDFCRPCMDRHGKLVKVSEQGRPVGMCESCFTGTPSKAHRQKVAARFAEMEKQDKKWKRATRRLQAQTLLEMAKEYIREADKRYCAICGDQKISGGTYCTQCQGRREILIKTKSWLRSYNKNGNTKLLSNAMGLIRRYGIKPEDLQFV